MEYLAPAIVFIFGLVIGSFLNVVIFRYNTGKGYGGRSQCFSCARQLRWQELVPLLSFIFLMGRCKGCRARVSLQYFMVELLTAVVFTLTLARLGLFSTTFDPGLVAYAAASAVFFLFVMAILIVIAIYDLRHTIIPDGLVYTFILLALAKVGANALLNPGYPWFVDIVSGTLLSLFFAGLWYFSKGEWMGFGDAKLALGIGWFLPFTQKTCFVFFSF